MSGSDATEFGPGAPDRRAAPDLRLLPIVAGLWIGEVVVLQVAGSHPWWWALGSGVLLAGALLAATRGPVDLLGARTVVVWVSLCGLGLGGVVASAHLARLHPPVLEDAARSRSVLRAEGLVTGDPVVRLPADDGGRQLDPSWSVPVRMHSVTVRGQTYSVRVPALLQGDQVRDLRYGSRVDLTGLAREAWAPERHALTVQALGPIRVRSPPGPVAEVTTRIREAFRKACSGLPRDAAALLLGLAVGDESLLSAELDRAMIRAGLAHLTAVSGSNTSLVVGITMAVVAGLGLGWRGRVATCLMVLAGYVMLVRPEPSVLRAAAMGVVALIAVSAGGRRRGPPALLAAGLVLLIVLPEFALSLGFALSFAATAGLLVVGPSIAARLATWRPSRWLPAPVRAALAVATAAHLATLPLAVLMGNGASLVALPANVIVTPLVPFATILGLAAALTAPVLPAVAAVLAGAAAPATAGIALVARSASATPFGVVGVPDGSTGAIGTALVLGLVGVAVARRWRPWRSRRLVGAVAVAAVVAVAIHQGRQDPWPPPDWLVLACDVGQGDAVLIRPPGSTQALLVDVGPEGEAVVGCLEAAGVVELVVLLTHFHADHIDGLASVLDRWPVSVVLTTPVGEPAQGAAQVATSARAAGVPIRFVRSGDQLQVAGVDLDVVWPAHLADQSPANNSSVVAVATVPTAVGEVRVLLTGDIEPEAQSGIMAARTSPGAHVVKVPHHGSRYQVPRFASWSGARIALISAGRDNDYGHPSPAIVEQYTEAGAQVGRTDRQGALAVAPRGGRPRVGAAQLTPRLCGAWRSLTPRVCGPWRSRTSVGC